MIVEARRRCYRRRNQSYLLAMDEGEGGAGPPRHRILQLPRVGAGGRGSRSLPPTLGRLLLRYYVRELR